MTGGERLSYAAAGVDIAAADAAKEAMVTSMETADSRVLNRLGAFATLFDASFPGYQHPVLSSRPRNPARSRNSRWPTIGSNRSATTSSVT